MQGKPEEVLFITDGAYIDYEIAGGVQLCTQEFITYLKTAGYTINIFKVQPEITIAKKIKIKLDIEAYSIYEVDKYLAPIIDAIKTNNIKLMLFNQLNIAHWVTVIKNRLPADVKFIALSHGNESGDYLHHVTHNHQNSFIKTWRLGRLLIREKQIFSILDGVISISRQEEYINSWIGAKEVLYLPRILTPAFINWQQNAKQVGFVGTLDHLPNLDGIKRLAVELKKQNFGAELVLVGGPEHIGKQVEQEHSFIKYKGRLNSEQLENEVKTWAIFLNPVFWYARGSSTKLAQAINWGLPVITTPAGARGYDLADNAITTGDNSPATFAATVIRALNTPEWLNTLKVSSETNSKSFKIKPWANQLRSFIDNIKSINS
jgi:glycosyltransferase involved in cell wall biosynthesis